jgi:hypothetical protein
MTAARTCWCSPRSGSEGQRAPVARPEQRPKRLLNNPSHRQTEASGTAEHPRCDPGELAPAPLAWLAAEFFQHVAKRLQNKRPDPGAEPWAAAAIRVAIRGLNGRDRGEPDAAGLFLPTPSGNRVRAIPPRPVAGSSPFSAGIRAQTARRPRWLAGLHHNRPSSPDCCDTPPRAAAALVGPARESSRSHAPRGGLWRVAAQPRRSLPALQASCPHRHGSGGCPWR